MRTFEVPNAHAIEISEFLQKPAGQSLLNALYARRPEITGDDMEKRAMSGSSAQGWESCIEEIGIIAADRPNDTNVAKGTFINPNPDDDKNPAKRPDRKL